MIVAQIVITQGHFALTAVVHKADFDNLVDAEAEYNRIVDLMKRRAERANDLPEMLEIIGKGFKISMPLEDIKSVGLIDYAKTNTERVGMRDAFPNVFG